MNPETPGSLSGAKTKTADRPALYCHFGLVLTSAKIQNRAWSSVFVNDRAARALAGVIMKKHLEPCGSLACFVLPVLCVRYGFCFKRKNGPSASPCGPAAATPGSPGLRILRVVLVAY